MQGQLNMYTRHNNVTQCSRYVNVGAMMVLKRLQKCAYGSATRTMLHFTTTIVHDMDQIILDDPTISAGVWISGYLANTHSNMQIISSTYCITYEPAVETAA